MARTDVLLLIVLNVLTRYVSENSSAAALEPPRATAYTYKNNGLTAEKVEIVEAQRYILKEAVLVLECNATYPIEWIGHYKKLQSPGTFRLQDVENFTGTAEEKSYLRNLLQRQILARYVYELSETRRYAQSIQDPSSYKHTSILEVHYWEDSELQSFYTESGFSAFHSPSHFTCKATQTNDRMLQSHIYMTVYDENPQLFELELTNEYKSQYLEPSTLNGETICDNRSITAAKAKETGDVCLMCTDDELYLHTEYCYTATECNCIAAREVEATQCLQGGKEPSKYCFVPGADYRYGRGEKIYGPAVFFCTGAPMNRWVDRAQIVQSVILGVFRGDVRNESAVAGPIYLHWDEVDPTQMMYIHPIGRDTVYVGEEVTIKCEYSRFYFSHGSWFAIRHSDGHVEYIRAFEKKPCHRWRFLYQDVREIAGEKLVVCDWNVPKPRHNTFTATLRKKLEAVGDYEIFCIGPVWNTTEWVNVSLSVTVTDFPLLERPGVAISIYSEDGKSSLNAAYMSLTEVMVPNCNFSFLLKCTAAYPTEWIFRYNEETLQMENTAKETLVLAHTYRNVTSFRNRTTYSYTALTKFEYNGKLAPFSKFTCKSTQRNDPELETSVHVTHKGNTTTLQLQALRNKNADGVFQLNGESKGLTGMLRYTQPRPYYFCLSCLNTHSALQFQACRTPIECNSIFARKGKSNTDFDIGSRCSPWQMKHLEDFNPKYGRCEAEGNGSAVSGLLFFGVDKNVPELKVSRRPFFGVILNVGEGGHDENKKGAGDEEVERESSEIPVYSNWWDVDPSKMVYLHPVKPRVIPNETVEMTCEYSRFYFSLGSWFGIKGSDGNFQYFAGVDVRPCDTDTERAEVALGKANCNPNREAQRRGTFNATLTTKFAWSGSYQIFCIGPVWNTTEWASSSRFIVVDKWDPPKVLSVAPIGNKTLVIGERSRSLECKFQGNPEPNIRWTTPAGNWKKSIGRGEHTSVLHLENITFAHAGAYRCYAESLNQSDFVEYTFTPEIGTTVIVEAGALSGTHITGIVIICLLLLLGVTGVIARMRQTIAEQQKALRLLTDTEVKEFLEGSPEATDVDRSDYISNIVAIEALPYDTKYEIPLDRLLIDYSKNLGSGEYGIILKGKLRPPKTSSPNYVNWAVQFRSNENAATLVEGGGRSELLTQELEVAVKVCKKNLGVEPFKSLLSEVKVMAYLGQNENILSLIGASTENIRNREIYIAEELCHNGSLDIFVKKHKKKYFNMVRRGRYVDDLEPQNSTSAGELSESDLQCPFSTAEMIRWTRDVAAGVEYIHSKRVIHGDLALRNVLITKNLVAKVGDFGLSRRLGEVSIYSKTTECPLPWRSMAIESLLHLQFSVKSDMWSLGVTLWELFTLGSIPYQGLSHNSDFIKELENGTLRLPTPHLAPSSICDFLLMCWEREPEDRPSTVEIRAICDSLIPPITS